MMIAVAMPSVAYNMIDDITFGRKWRVIIFGGASAAVSRQFPAQACKVNPGGWKFRLGIVLEKGVPKHFPTLLRTCDKQFSLRPEDGVGCAIIEHRGVQTGLSADQFAGGVVPRFQQP